MTTEDTIWEFLKTKGLNEYAIAGIMGNLFAESALYSNNLEDSRNAILGSDEVYTRNVDNGRYTRSNFINDGAGYGLAQWTTKDRKSNLYDYCKTRGKSISDLTCQLEFLYEELKNYNLLTQLNASNSVNNASDIILLQFERPKRQDDSVKEYRASLSQNYYNSFKKSSIKIAQGAITKNMMKYNFSNTPMVCMQTNSTCYKNTSTMAVKGVLWHSTGANNPNLKRYVQPSENDPNYGKLISLLGSNSLHNDWNHISIEAGLNAWVGKLADGSITSVQTMPWDYKPWGCGSGSRGSCNNGWIQFEICEDALIDGTYFTKVYNEACELTAYLCNLYNINPKGTVNFNGITVPTILCHADSASLGLGSNHADVLHWFSKFGKTMENVREDVAKKLNDSNSRVKTEPVQIVTPTKTLKNGSSGQEVKDLQEKLLKLGYYLGTWGADGDFGSCTEEAVRTFQKLHNLNEDGIVDSQTWTAIEMALADLSKPQVYRIRKSWDNINSQVGAYTNLARAKKVVDNLNDGYHVYDNDGKEIYPTNSISSSTSTEENKAHIAPANTYNDVMLGYAAKDERGSYSGGQPGDQSGKEVYINGWYSQGWNVVLRPKSDKLAEAIAQQCEAGCKNDNIGYSQSARNTIYIEVQKVGMDLAQIKTPCNCDCSSFVGTVCICAGLPAKDFYSGNMPVTSNLRDCCLATGQFNALSGQKYTRQKDYLKRGDILLNESAHVVIVLSDGKKVEKNNETVTPTKEGFPYKVRVTAKSLNVRKSPTEASNITAQIRHGYVFTIVDEKEGFGKLKSGIGWINLQYTERV